MMSQIEPDVLKQLESYLEKIKNDLGVNSDDSENFDQEIEELLGLTQTEFDELDKEVMDMMRRQIVNVELIHPDAVFPSYAYPSDSGFDLYSTEEITIPPFGRALVPTGLKLSFKEGYEIQIRTKSGLAINQGLIVLNSPGTVDQGYTGECKVPVFNTNPTELKISKKMKVAQAVVCPVMNGKFIHLNKVEKIGDGDRGDNGFGSTGI